MSMTFAPANNSEYCRANGLVTYQVFDAGTPYEERFEVFPFELNVCNANGYHIQELLGLEPDYYGSVNPYSIKTALMCVSPTHDVRPLNQLDGVTMGIIDIFFGTGERVRIVDGGAGTHPEDIERYRTKLLEIANEAIRREVDVVWS